MFQYIYKAYNEYQLSSHAKNKPKQKQSNQKDQYHSINHTHNQIKQVVNKDHLAIAPTKQQRNKDLNKCSQSLLKNNHKKNQKPPKETLFNSS